ncbi:MAG: type III pantothenate kinase [Bacteroidota bacterium]
MKALLVDIGNTLIKTAVADQKQIIEFRNWSELVPMIDYVIEQGITLVFVVSVTDRHFEIKAALPEGVTLKVFDRQTPLPINNHYKTKDTLGLDRIVALMGAGELFPNRHNLVIDVGTCITYDLLDADNNYYGGAISPGIGIRLRSLHDYTSKLPHIEVEPQSEHPAVTGDSSANSILSGVLNGILFELEGFISSFSVQYEDLNTIITGGDGYRFESTIKAPIFVAPKLILIGLYRILKENEEI